MAMSESTLTDVRRTPNSGYTIQSADGLMGLGLQFWQVPNVIPPMSRYCLGVSVVKTRRGGLSSSLHIHRR